jgi:tetratricopeptide (TPR) repeat protein
MLTDRYGLAVSTSSAAARDAYVSGCDLLFQGNAGPLEAFQAAIDADPRFALAHAGKARTLQLKGDAAASRAAMAEANALAAEVSEREKSHLAYYSLVNAGQLDPAVAAAREHLKHWPRDAMVLSPCTSVFGLIGFSGHKGRERAQVEILDWLAPAYGDDWWFCAQHAFALDEVGQRSAARRKIERVMVQTPRNAHAAHILAHVMYEDGAMDAARRYLAAWLPAYERAAILHCHVSWHLALCELEAGHAEAAFAIFDDAIDPAATSSPPINVLTDAAAFLWRAELAGGRREMARWRKVHEFAHRNFPRAGIAFSDTHILLADAVCGDNEGFARRMREIDERAAQGKQPSGPVVPALARGFAAFVAEDWNAAIAAIEPVMGEHERIGGSRAQRDLVEFTLLRAYLNAGREADARRYLDHRREGACRAMVAGVAALG